MAAFRDEYWLFVAKTCSADEFAEYLRERVSEQHARGFTDTRHVSHSVTMTPSGKPLWSAVVLLAKLSEEG
jgi:hypothetical protein